MSDNNKSAPATKDDIKALDTKVVRLEDVTKNMALDMVRMQGDINNIKERMATKDDLTAVDTKLSIAIAKTQEDVREIRHDIATKLATRDDISRLMNHIDAFAAEALSHRNHDTLRGGKIMEHETRLSDHENRLTTLETK